MDMFDGDMSEVVGAGINLPILVIISKTYYLRHVCRQCTLLLSAEPAWGRGYPYPEKEGKRNDD